MSNDSELEVQTKQVNEEVRKFSDEVVAGMKGAISALGIKGKQELLKRLKSDKAKAKLMTRISKEGILKRDVKKKIYYKYGEAFGVGFKFPRHGIFLSKGVGKGRPVSSPGEKKDFFNPAIDSRFNDFANKITEIYADKVDVVIRKIK